MKKSILFFIIALLFVDLVSAATIHGTVYDFSLDKINNAIIEINTNPVQRQIAIDASYKFNVQKGSYTITAKNQYNEILITENIEIIDEGDYTLDLISLLEIDEDLLNPEIDPEADLETLERNGNNTWLIIVILIIIIFLSILFYRKRKHKKTYCGGSDFKGLDETDLTNKVLEIIKKQEGRTTQKELRKLLPYSEAKISLVLTELESKGKIEKIKKGRSNVIILKN